jgi:hypothetical protein
MVVWCLANAFNACLTQETYDSRGHTANEGSVRIQYKCLVLIYVFVEMKLRVLCYYV